MDKPEENNNGSWRTRVDIFRGWVRGKVEGMETDIKDTKTGIDTLNAKFDNHWALMTEQIASLREFKAAQVVKNVKYGFFGGAGGAGVLAVLYWLLKEVIGWPK